MRSIHARECLQILSHDDDTPLPLAFVREDLYSTKSIEYQDSFEFYDSTLAKLHYHIYDNVEKIKGQPVHIRIAVKHGIGWQEALIHTLWGEQVFNPDLLHLTEIDAFPSDLLKEKFSVISTTNGRYEYPSSNHIPTKFRLMQSKARVTKTVKPYITVEI